MVINAGRIIAEGDVGELVDTAQMVGTVLARQLTTSQIRNVFGEIRRIEMIWREQPDEAYRRFVLLQPKLAYQVRREKGAGVEEFRSVLDPCIEIVRKAPAEKRKVYFARFVDFLEAILAYHKAAGGN